MFIVYWLVGFVLNFLEVLFHAIPMSITAGNIASNREAFPWEIDEEDFLKALEEGEKLKDD